MTFVNLGDAVPYYNMKEIIYNISDVIVCGRE